MKTLEDEAFDELARKQGAWGGGFQAKRKMAADKLREPEREALKLALTTLEGWDNHDKWVWPETALEQAKRNTKEAITAIKAALAQPAQEPVACERCKQLEEQAYDLLGQLQVANLKRSVAQPAQEPPKYAIKAYWEDDGRIGVVATVERPDGGYHLLGAIIDPPPAKEKNT